MEELAYCVNILLQGNSNGEGDRIIKCFYNLLKDAKLTGNEDHNFWDKLLPNIYLLYEKEILRKDLLYMTLLAADNYEVLQKFTEYDKKCFSLNIRNPSLLFDFSIYFKEHWFYEMIKTNNISNTENIDECLHSKLLLLDFLMCSNADAINVDKINKLIPHLKFNNIDDFWTYYIKEVTCLVNVADFCKSKSPELNASKIVQFSSNNSLLNTFSTFLNLQKYTISELESVYIQLKQFDNDKDYLSTEIKQSEVFQGFIILSTVFNLVYKEQSNNQRDTMKDVVEIKNKLLEIHNKDFQLELLENMFALLFLKTDNYLEDNLNKNSDFICKEKHVRLILYMLQSIVNVLKVKNTFIKYAQNQDRFNNFNKYLNDALWRLDLISNVKNNEKTTNYIMKYMLSSPEYLIMMCLKQGDFERAYQVMGIFNLNDSGLANKVIYAEKLQHLKESIKKQVKLREQEKSTTQGQDKLVSNIETFFKSNFLKPNTDIDEIINKYTERNKIFNHYTSNYEIFLNILDICLTQIKSLEDCENLLHIIYDNSLLDTTESSDFLEFVTKIIAIFKDIGFKQNLSISDILISNIPMDIDVYKKQGIFFKELSKLYEEFIIDYEKIDFGILNSKHNNHKSVLKLSSLCGTYLEDKEAITDDKKYLTKLFKYLKSFSKIVYIEGNNSDIISQKRNTSYFEFLQFNRSELVGKLLFERNLDPSEFEKFFYNMKLDYLYHVVGNCFPTINLHTKENITKDELYPENNLYLPNKSIIIYIQKRNWLLALILNEMYNIEDVKIDISVNRIETFLNYMKLPRINHLKEVFDKNIIITALQHEINFQKIDDYVNSQILKQDAMLRSQISTDSVETGEEILEDVLKTTNWKHLHDIIESIPENQLIKTYEFVKLRDKILCNMVIDKFEIEYYKYVQFIDDRNMRIDTILENFQEWPGHISLKLFKSEVTRFDVALIDSKFTELQSAMYKLKLYEDIKTILKQKTPTFSEMFQSNSQYMVEQLLLSKRVDILLNYVDFNPQDQDVFISINEEFMLNIFEFGTSKTEIELLLSKIPVQLSVKLCHKLLGLLKNLEQLQIVTDYLSIHDSDNVELVYIQISLKILSNFTQTEQEQLLCLINKPLYIIEVLLMNAKLDKLETALFVLNKEILQIKLVDEDELSEEKIDEMLRNYAEKSLDFRVISQPNPRLLRTPECKLMQSLDSLNFGSDHKMFIMPENVPTKEEWIQNNEVLECMCCQKVAFSMFMRRHHCRRCGRVICYKCSLKRMLVESYGDIMVRVCFDCYEQTNGGSISSGKTDTVSLKSLHYDVWLLRNDDLHNQIMREEFSFEHAPSVSLCLSILKHHSKTVEYPKFLLEQCQIMLKLVQPNQDPFQEIDYMLVIKMLKSLAVAAKMSSVECALHYGTSLADRILSQVELLGLLAERNCLNLLPVATVYSQRSDIDASVLRRLRDRLLEREQWNLALEMSTKVGFDNTGVFAAWGKNCLKAGCLLLAREKFHRCLDKNSHFDPLLEVHESTETLSRTRYFSRVSNLSNLSETKPIKNPPLLNEIIEILESKINPTNPELIRKETNVDMYSSNVSLNQNSTYSLQPDTAISVVNKLQNLNNISNGCYTYVPSDLKNSTVIFSNVPKIDSVFYDECIYYLRKYGTHLSLLEFYIRHGEINKALAYIIQNQLSNDIYIEIYVKCLKDGIVNLLHEHMSKMDSTLDIWKDYLRQICHYLEKQNLLHSLYELQQFMGDYIRAAMTCIRFYQENVANFSELSVNVKYLHKAEEHLKQVLEQEQWVEVATVRRYSIAEGSQESFEEKGITNPSLVLKINPRDIDKHINTIWRQNEVSNFLAECESSGFPTITLLRDILPQIDASTKENKIKIVTLFGSNTEKIQLAILAIVCGKNVEDGFGIAFRIVQDFKLKPLKVYCQAGKLLANSENYDGIAQLVSCIKSSGISDKDVADMCDEMLTLAVTTLSKAHISNTKVENLIKLITDRATKISAYIETKQLKTAYFLAVKYKRMSDIRRILREAELLNQPTIIVLCQKVLQSYPHLPSATRE